MQAKGPDYHYQGTPDPDSGTRIMSAKELMDMVNDPVNGEKFRNAINLVEKQGKFKTGVKQVVYNQCVRDNATMERVAHVKRTIDAAEKKSREKIG